jgi:L-2-hydroxyglutarate oxidase LhgO
MVEVLVSMLIHAEEEAWVFPNVGQFGSKDLKKKKFIWQIQINIVQSCWVYGIQVQILTPTCHMMDLFIKQEQEIINVQNT